MQPGERNRHREPAKGRTACAATGSVCAVSVIDWLSCSAAWEWLGRSVATRSMTVILYQAMAARRGCSTASLRKAFASAYPAALTCGS